MSSLFKFLICPGLCCPACAGGFVMGTGLGVFLIYAAAIFGVIIFGRVLAVPLKIAARLVLSSLLGGAVLMIINFFGADFGIEFPVNFITALIAGIAGVPGVIAMMMYFNLSN